MPRERTKDTASMSLNFGFLPCRFGTVRSRTELQIYCVVSTCFTLGFLLAFFCSHFFQLGFTLDFFLFTLFQLFYFGFLLLIFSVSLNTETHHLKSFKQLLFRALPEFEGTPTQSIPKDFYTDFEKKINFELD